MIRILRIFSGTGWYTPAFGADGSDTAKFLEAACYALVKRDDPKLSSHVEEQIEWIRTSQWDDGYINSYFTLVEPENRFTNLRSLSSRPC